MTDSSTSPVAYSCSVAKKNRKTIGWREWVSIPELGVSEIKAKVDTGADNSSLHAFNLERFEEDGVPMVRFGVHPRQRKSKPNIHCVSEVVKERKVKNPGGRTELRPVIRTKITVGWSRVGCTDQSDHQRRDDLSYAFWVAEPFVKTS